MDIHWKKYRVIFICILLLTLIGCEKKQLGQQAAPASTPVASNKPRVEPIEVPPVKTGTDNVTTNSVDSEKQTTDTSTEETEHNDKQADTPTPSAKPEVKDHDTYNTNKPTLMGLQLNASQSVVSNTFGNPKSEHKLEDDGGVIHVLNYDDFSIGLNTKSQVEFIEIHSDEIDPGLGGIKVGSSSADVINSLGKPSTNTNYVISYKSQGTILKFDVDIDEDKILSIKLFPNN
ncbi:hypothetical protein E0485_20170 [Paenibacillus albiflavus]|uniref:DUF4309 domain-containing protein n=1 Tax=Paenibacillus albiflavus TaxID=2545760 RepID=A0A4R4E5J8_9BACL|nr:hypothetical protein [Paenibacillus albiflavus]TCZ74297.1 hypothetical protein E0485_20170 [Paenibacillus albiflavus]